MNEQTTASVDFARAVSAGLRSAVPLDLGDIVLDVLDPENEPADALFRRAYTTSLAQLPRAERSGRLAGATGHVGESVVAVLLVDLGYHVLRQFVGPLSGGHGVDLLMLSPDDRVVAIEVKATLRPGRWPRPSRGELAQLSPAWLGKPDNPGMAELGLTDADVYGMVAVVNFADRRWRAVLTDDFQAAHAVREVEDLVDWSWLPARPQ
ncbi:MAG: hypothetical protein H0U10_12235 [Chloroflexia bacterium]|nr:hypothetical protein [Chloroflexia bacterium]